MLTTYATRYKYDSLGHLSETTDPLGNMSSTIYDAFGNAVVVEDKAGYATTFLYDKTNNLVLQFSAEGNAIRTDYDAFGKPVSITHYNTRLAVGTFAWKREPAAISVPTSSGDATTTLQYDKLNRLTQATDAEGYIEVFAYNSFGDRISYQNKLGGQYTYEYDLRGLMLSETLPILSKGRAVTNRFEYDARGNRTTTIEASGLAEQRITRFEFDALNRQIKQTSAAFVVVTNASGVVSSMQLVETRAYDARGNLIETVDAAGNRVTTYFDAADRKTGQVSAGGTLTLWTNDAVGNVVVTRIYADLVGRTSGAQAPSPVNPANVRETRNTFNANNSLIVSRIVDVTTGRVSDTNDRLYLVSTGDVVRMWEYDARGLPIVAIDGYGNRTLSFYNGVGLKILEVDSEGYGTSWTRNANGDVTTMRRFAHRYPDPISVSDRGTLLSATWPRSADDRVTNYQWDRNGRLVREERTGDSQVAYATVSATTGLSQRLGTAITTYQYDAEGHLTRQVDANGSARDWQYDAAGRQTQYSLPLFLDYTNTLSRVSVSYQYDGLGRVIRQTGDAKGGADFSFKYDAGGRLESKTNLGLNFDTQFGYDALGNTTLVSYLRTNPSGAVVFDATYIAYDTENHEVSRVAKTLDPSKTQTTSTGTLRETRYNAFGEITGRRTNGGGTGGTWQEYAEYNNFGMVVRTNFDDGISHAFMYDQAGNATLKVESQTTDLRTWAGADILKDIDLNQTFTKFDKRGQIIGIMQPKVSLGAPRVTLHTVDIQVDGGKFANTQLTVGGWVNRPESPAMVVQFASYTYVWESGILSVGGVATGGWVRKMYDPQARSATDRLDIFGRMTAHTDYGGHT